MEFALRRPVAALLLGLLLSGFQLALGASFYGESYVELKTAESSSQTFLLLRFLTIKPNGLLFLAAGQTDYCLVRLHSGRLQVKLEFGAGERVLHSERRSKFNDLTWHTIELHHTNGNVTLTIDKHFKTSIKMPEPFYELNVKHGLYVGGTSGLETPYLQGIPTSFRGCIDEAMFNKHDLLTSLRSYPGLKNVYEVSFGCSSEFFVGEDEPISFFSSKSYVSFPLWNLQGEGVFESALRTVTKQGLLLYNSGPFGDFIAMELDEGLIITFIGKGGSKTKLSSLSTVNDNQWHYIKLKFTPRHLQLTVDEETVQASLTSRNKALNLKGPLFVGGIDDSIRAEVRKLGLISLSGKHSRGGSFKGCVKELKANSEKRSLKNALVTKDISAGCKAEKVPDTTTVLPTNSIVSTVTTTAYTTTSTVLRTFKPPQKEKNGSFVVLNNLVVAEGGRASLESKNIKVNLNFKKLGIRQSQIVFKIARQPRYGQLRLDVKPEQEENSFTMLDLWHGRIVYIHDGSEDPHDHFMFSVLTNSKKEVPAYLKGDKQYAFNITVTPINDAPELTLPEGNLFSLIEHSKKCLTTDVIKAIDIDTNATGLQFSVLGNLNADAGFLENSNNPGKVITTFSNTDLVHGNIYYVHNGVRNSRIVLRVSDGEKVSNTVVLRVMAVPLEYRIANNKGLKLVQGDAALITAKQLDVQTNVVKQDLDIRYEITEHPKYGEVQRWYSSGEWKHTSTFSQRIVERDRVRYLSTFREIQTGNITDRFKFKVSIGSKTSEELTFPIIVKWVQYKLLKKQLDVDKEKKNKLNSENLLAVTVGMKIPEDELYYRLLSTPNKGKLLLNNKVLKKNSKFSQRNITNQKVAYELHNIPREDSQDSFSFQLSSKHADSMAYTFQVKIKADVNSVILRNNGLLVKEGEGHLITKTELFAETLNSEAFYYEVIKSPQHGKLKRINLSDSVNSNDNITSFTNQDITEERLMYVHDDSETNYDEFTAIATAKDSVKVPEPEVEPVEFKFNISIELKNDEKPIRIVDKVFHVVRNGQKLLTLEDLCYHDPDFDFSDGQLLYTRRGIPNGDLVLVNNTLHKLYQFKQEDMEQKRVLFIHHGADYGRFALFVTDGKYSASSLLEVSALDPYINIANNTGLLVQKGQENVLTTNNFSVITNLDVRSEKEILYHVFLQPKHGGIYKNNLLVDSFTQNDLKMGHLVYRHDNSNHLFDKFNLTVKVKDMHLDAGINIRIFLESHQRPPRILHNSSLLVEEGKPVKISKRKLEVVHEDSSPSEIMYTVRIPPDYGYIRSFADVEERYVGTEQKPIQAFTQQDINHGNIQYVQITADQLKDNFTLDVTNGITEFTGIQIFIDIIPRLIPLEVNNFTVKEGGSKALTEDYIKISNPHFAGINSELTVVDPPKHGYIENSRFPGVQLTFFTRVQVEQEFIYYVHDDSETLSDNFTVLANDSELRKQSLPCTVFVNVTPVNDEAPVITTNKIFRAWVSAVTEITKNDLHAQDKDSPPEELIYSITPPSNGRLALKSFPNKNILNFTQAHVNQRQLVFVHNGAMSGGFNFQVTDGLNFAPRQIFSITARTLVISLEINKGLTIFPATTLGLKWQRRTSKYMSSEDLKAVTNDEDSAENRTITFTIANSPKLGKLVTIESDNSTKEVFSFTQDMIDAGQIAYVHTASATLNWTTKDSFQFTVSSPPASLEPQVFHITISYENQDRHSHLLANTGAIVTEGDKVLIGKSKLDASNLVTRMPESQRSSYEVWYQVTALPKHGVIVVGERNITKEKPNFSQYILNKFGVTYLHDDSESTVDNFTFAVWLNLKSKSASRPLNDSEVVEEMFNITVTPVNDQPPELKTKTPNLRIVQGYTLALRPENLKTIDLDNKPENIKYTIISNPNNGFLAMNTNLNTSIQHFTQADINSDRVWFVQDGTPHSGVFYFSVSDGKHRPLYKLFNLEVVPITVSFANITSLVVQQGKTFILITNEQLAAETNGKDTRFQYRITQPPKSGHLLIGTEEVTMFEQEDLDQKRLSYHMTDFTAFQDSFEITLSTSESNLTEQAVNITVEPLLQMATDLTIPNGITYKLRKEVLDASELANLTNSIPKFTIIEPPVHSKFIRMRHRCDATSENITVFTQRDLEMGLVHLHIDTNMTGTEALSDSFTFVLTADKVQPARGELVYIVVPYDPLFLSFSTTQSPVSTSTSMQPAANNLTALVKLSVPSEKHVVTQAPIRTVQRWKSRNRWGSPNRNDSLLIPQITTSVNMQREITTQPIILKPVAQPSESSPLSVIIPLVIVAAFLFIIILVIIVLIRRKKQKALTKAQPNTTTPNSPSIHQAERSLAVPTVTVTALSNGGEASPLMTAKREQTVANAAPQETVTLLYNCKNLDPEMAQHCRTTNPTLRQNQYWV
ncbi:chondroitin sulfate proteoglycan 4 isoform X2 [Latimeria chalumnae]|uniref:chondroitin sulfate proteoglycan 4 isoform X2 n=1 Tax=Latimeria chalumnae TaxID=7897 RepID=UPI0003C19C4A|nr:PREDICTED: chondroitin sulfate proteoglycan 4-like isoform X2 [Latimeria chalumnae]|eukprot:XP_006007039.1 PREDICTED: chondroitin sulfate proteoglycan 4-like isoform X2 [Latimeria chalumnae]